MKKDEQKRTEIKNKVILGCACCVVAAMLIFGKVTQVAAAETVAGMAVFPGVTVSPDGTAWTTDYLDTTDQRLEKGHTVYTGIESGLRELQLGEHYYKVSAEGSINIGKWVIAWPNAQCIHDIPYYDTFCGFPIESDSICLSNYNNGWYAYCADCGELVEEMLFYAKSTTVSGITSMPAHAMYLYICPYCQGLEQGRTYSHVCKDISYNYYSIFYEANTPAEADKTVSGYMSPTRHMYNNASTYNGTSAVAQGYGDTHLRENSYSCVGYKFIGWNTSADGSGTFFNDCEEVLNLTTEEGGTVRLYAQWKKTKSTLVLDANGGQYNGESVYERTQEYGSSYKAAEELIVPAPGYEVTFEANGGSTPERILTTKSFAYWEMQNGFQGNFENNIYIFSGDEGSRSILKVQYTNNSFILPDSEKKDASLAGWYTDPDFSEDSFVGKPGGEMVVEEDTKLYAKWATLTLWAYDDYESNNGHGAVDLVWEQKDGQSKYYRIFRSTDKEAWKEIFEADTIASTFTVSETFGTDKQGKTYAIEQTGFYTLTANGAKGADYSTALKGGAGGSVSATYWLQKGDVISFYAGFSGSGINGGTNQVGSSGGASETSAGGGGGAATEVYVTRNGTKTLLLVAGGGAGANENYAGGAGGTSLTAVGNSVGNSSAFGGGGGGAQGGTGGSTAVATTPSDTQDFVFKSNLSANLAAGTVQVYGMRKEMAAPSLTKVTGTGQNSWKNITVMGSMSSAFSSYYELWYDDEYCAFYGSMTGAATVGTVPYIQTQVRDGIDMYLYNTYDTKGNTNLLVGGGLYRQDYEAEGHTRLRLMVTNADTGATIYNELMYHGYSNDDVAGIAAVVDVDISSASRITVKIISETEGTQENTVGHKTQLYFSDIIFYGKTVSKASAATGGSSYINTEFGCINQMSSAGVNDGEGYAVIKGEDIGYKEYTSLDDVPANDTAVPDVIEEYLISIVDANRLNVTFMRPKDNGTTYYHIAKSYKRGSDAVQQLAASNITKNTLTTGVTGYYYYVDALSTGTAGVQNNWIAADSNANTLAVTLTESVMYLHVAAADGAGNVGPTRNIRLYIDETLPTDPVYAENRTLFTEQLELEESAFVYQESDKTYYVKADGMTEHKLLAEAYMDGAAAKDYQIDSICLHIGGNDGTYQEWLKAIVPKGDVAQSSTVYSNDSLAMDISDGCLSVMQPGVSGAERSNHGITLSLEQGFMVSADGVVFDLYPQAEAELNGRQYSSDEQSDMTNGLVIIPDGTPPVIVGLEELIELDILDMTEQTKIFELAAEDTGSGLAEFVVTVSNKDNFMKEEFVCDSEGKVRLEIEKENPLFVGEIVISAIATDRVANANIIGEGGLTFTLETDLYKARNPEESIFKTGDSAVLDITTAGYVEKIEVIFPEELLQLNPELPLVYEYEYPYLRNTETIIFRIPLGIPEQEYEITVKAYKNEEMLVSRQTLVVVEGNVLDELRTRIRNNG